MFMVNSVGQGVIWDLNTGKSILLDDYKIAEGKFSPNGNEVIVTTTDGKVYMRSLFTGASQILKGHGGNTVNTIFSPDGSLIATISGDSSIRVGNWRGDSLITISVGTYNEAAPSNITIGNYGQEPHDINLNFFSDRFLSFSNDLKQAVIFRNFSSGIEVLDLQTREFRTLPAFQALVRGASLSQIALNFFFCMAVQYIY